MPDQASSDPGTKTVLILLSSTLKSPKTARRKAGIYLNLLSSPHSLHPIVFTPIFPVKGEMEAWTGERLKETLQ